MTSPAAEGTPSNPLTGRAGVAAAACLLAWLALLPAPAGAAQDRGRSPSPETLWKEYPLAPTAEPGAQPSATSSPAASARTNPRPVGAARADSDGGAPVVVLVLLALITAGGTLIVGIRRRRPSEPGAAAVPLPPRAVDAEPVVPPMWNGRLGRFSRAATRTTPTMVATQGRGGGAPRVAGGAPQDEGGKGPRPARDPPVRNGAAAPAAGKPAPVTPAVAAVPAGSPPDRRLAWEAEIEWREIDGESRFCVIARGAGTVAVAQSPPLEWPPSGPASVQAITDAAEALAATLAAAGWKTLPPGRAWYAKRFAWEPVGAERAKAMWSKSAGAAGSKPVANAGPAPGIPAPGGAGAPGRTRGRRLRRKQLALLGVLAVLGLVTALQIGGGSDGAPAGRSAPTPATQAPGTPGAEPTAAPKAEASDGTDLTVPLLVLLGVPVLVLMISQIRHTLR